MTMTAENTTAKNQGTEHFDVLIVVETLDIATDRFISECAWEAGFEHGVIVSPLAYSRTEYEREAASPLLRAIEQEGELV